VISNWKAKEGNIPVKYSQPVNKRMNKFQYMICITLRAPLISFNTSLIHASYKIFNVKSKDVVHKCKTEFGVFPAVADVIDIKKKILS